MKFEIAKLEAFLQDFFEKRKVPGMSVCINGPEGTLYKKGFGFRDLEKEKPVDTETIFGIGSMSKSITAICLSILESEGKFSFRDPVSKYLPALKIPGTPNEALLVHHFANMTSGIPPLPGTFISMLAHTNFGPWIEPGLVEMGRNMVSNPISTVEDLIEYINGSDYEPLGAPGEYMSYSNDCYAMLSTIVDIVSGSTLEQFAHDRIFEPLGMTRTTFDIDEAKAMGNITSIFATNGGQLFASDDWDVAPPYRGAGWVKSTCEDMCKYYETLACDGVLRGKRVLPEGCVARTIGHAFPETADGIYCYGMMKRVFNGLVLHEHAGGMTGVASMGGFFFSDGGYATTVLMNIGMSGATESGPSPVVPYLAMTNMLLGLPLKANHVRYMPSGETPEDPKMYVGTYVSNEFFPPTEFTISKGKDGELYVNGSKSKLLLCETTVFALDDGTTPIDQSLRAKFFIRGGKAWGMDIGSRMYQREED